ncbi:hypothetical protein N9L68_07375 [bacterium]|nr:hypothetical protein [bacterium]
MTDRLPPRREQETKEEQPPVPGNRTTNVQEDAGFETGATDPPVARASEGTGPPAGSRQGEGQSERQERGRHQNKGGLTMSLERAARRRLNGAVGGSRAPAHYQALLPEQSLNRRALRLWYQEVGSPMRTQQSLLGDSMEWRQPSPLGSSVDSIPSPAI